MMKKSVIAAGLGLSLLTGAASAGTLTIDVQGVENAKGNLLVAVYAPGKFISENEKDIAYPAEVPAKPGTVQVTIPNMKPGDYTFAVFHDEDADQELDKNWVGMPKEGIAFSNDAKIKMAPPKESDATFKVTEEGAKQVVTLVY